MSKLIKPAQINAILKGLITKTLFDVGGAGIKKRCKSSVKIFCTIQTFLSLYQKMIFHFSLAWVQN